MQPVSASLEQLGGIASLRQLHNYGHGDGSVFAACKRGAIIRLRRGWYASASADPALAAAITIGGRLGCVSACATQGIWQPPFAGLHVAVARGANHLVVLPEAQQVSLDGVHLHWMASRSIELTEAQPLVEALAAAFVCQPEEYAFAMLESALHLGVLETRDKARLKRRVAQRFWKTIDCANSLSESGTESVFKFFAHRDGFEFKQQVEFLGGARVDFLFGERQIVEIDSEKHHGAPWQRLRDLERDAWLASFGGATHRFDYRMVFWDWELVRAALQGALQSEIRHDSPSLTWQ